MDMTAHVLKGWPTYPDQIALQRGPEVLALPKALNPQVKDLAAATLLATDLANPQLTPANALPANWLGDQAYTVPGEYQGQPQQLILAPFADARAYRIWLKSPTPANASVQ